MISKRTTTTSLSQQEAAARAVSLNAAKIVGIIIFLFCFVFQNNNIFIVEASFSSSSPSWDNPQQRWQQRRRQQRRHSWYHDDNLPFPQKYNNNKHHYYDNFIAPQQQQQHSFGHNRQAPPPHQQNLQQHPSIFPRHRNNNNNNYYDDNNNKHNINASTTIQQLLHYTNLQRSQFRLNQLQYNTELQKAAQIHANDMAQKSYFSHIAPGGGGGGRGQGCNNAAPQLLSDRVKQYTSYRYQRIGENLYCQWPDNNPSNAVQGWMDSPSHRQNMLHPDFIHVGFGYAINPNNDQQTHYYVQVLGKPLKYYYDSPVVAGTDATCEALFCQINQARRQANLSPLVPFLQLNHQAQQQAQYMAQNQRLSTIFQPTTTAMPQSNNRGRSQHQQHLCRVASFVSFMDTFNDPHGVVERLLKDNSSYILSAQFTRVGVGYAQANTSAGGGKNKQHYYALFLGEERRQLMY